MQAIDVEKIRSDLQDQMDKDQITGEDGTVYTVKQLREIFEKHQSQEHWKKPFSATMRTFEDMKCLKTAIAFYLGDEARVQVACGEFGITWFVATKGYQAW